MFLKEYTNILYIDVDYVDTDISIAIATDTDRYIIHGE